MNWFILVIIVAVLFLILLSKASNFRSRIAYFLIFIGIGFLILSIFIVFYDKDIDLTSLDGVVASARLYASWLGHAGSNVVKITGYAINQNWGLNSTTNTTSTNTKSK